MARILATLFTLFALTFSAAAQEALPVDDTPDLGVFGTDTGILYMGAGIDWHVIGHTIGDTLARFADLNAAQYMGDPTYPGNGEHPDWHINSHLREAGGTWTTPYALILFPTDEPTRLWDTLAIYLGLDGEVYVLPFDYNVVNFTVLTMMQETILQSGSPAAIAELDATLALSHNQNPHPISGMWQIDMSTRQLMDVLMGDVLPTPAPEGKEYLNCLNHLPGWHANDAGWCVRGGDT